MTADLVAQRLRPGAEKEYDNAAYGRSTSAPSPAISPPGFYRLTDSHSRYAGQDWRTRLFGSFGTVTATIAIVGAAYFGWDEIKKSPMMTAKAPLVMELSPLTSPPREIQNIDDHPEDAKPVEKMQQPAAPQDITPLRTLPVQPYPPVQRPADFGLAPANPVPEKMAAPAPATPPAQAAPPSQSPPTAQAAPSAERISGNKANWEGRLLAHLEQYRRYPARARAARQQGVVYIRFKMNRAGAVLSASIQRGSGFRTLDDAALETLQRAQPLPAIPNDMPDVVTLTVPVEFSLRR
ncbi:energy transducer TonB [Pseudonocardia sp. TMWB2A]|uniref:energy transducer TonB family protein n=1 Tax=Pseudonocardia sp. TMWB2A TaxID=687430 RepID=UPI00307D0203